MAVFGLAVWLAWTETYAREEKIRNADHAKSTFVWVLE